MMKLQTNWESFSDTLDSHIKDGWSISNKEGSIRNQEDLNQISGEIKAWVEEVYKFINDAFGEERNSYAWEFRSAKGNRFNIPGNQKDFNQTKKELFEDFREKIITLEYTKRILFVSDAIIRPDTTDLNIRSKYSTNEILGLILDKLYDLYDNSFHPIKDILEGNGIPIRRHGEDREFVRMLADNGLVEPHYTQDAYAQLTLEGKMQVEEARQIASTDYSKIDDTQQEINIKVDELIAELKKLGFGQEILFDELQELKELYSKLGKKTWGQVLKGKLVDLGLGQVISYDVAKSIYEHFTDQTLRLPT